MKTEQCVHPCGWWTGDIALVVEDGQVRIHQFKTRRVRPRVNAVLLTCNASCGATRWGYFGAGGELLKVGPIRKHDAKEGQ